MNTVRLEFRDFSGYHFEGGWPKHVTAGDPEQTEKHIKKMEVEETFQESLPIIEDVYNKLENKPIIVYTNFDYLKLYVISFVFRK